MSARTRFRVTTYWQRPRGEPGLTQVSSRRLDLGEALDWVLREIPEEAITMCHDGDRVTLTIDWGKVPGEVRSGAS